jgi:hypothetical protein
LKFVDLLLQPLQFCRDVGGNLSRRGQFGYEGLWITCSATLSAGKLQGGVRFPKEFGSGDTPRERSGQCNQQREPEQTPSLIDGKATTQQSQGAFLLKCVLR